MIWSRGSGARLKQNYSQRGKKHFLSVFLRLKLYKSLPFGMPSIRTDCPRNEVFTFWRALQSLSLSLTPPSDSPSLCEGGQSRGSWLQSRSKTQREKYCSTKSDSVHVQNKRGHMTNGTAEWTEQSIAPDVRDWCITLIWRRMVWKVTSLSPWEVKGNMFPTKMEEKRLAGLSQRERKMERGGLKRTKIAEKWPSCVQCRWEHLQSS